METTTLLQLIILAAGTPEGTVGPQYFPQLQDIRIAEFSLEQNQQPAETEEKISRVSRVQISRQVRVVSVQQGTQLV